MGGQIIHHVVERLCYRESFRMALEYRQKGIGLVIGLTFETHISIGMIQEGEYVQGAVADVFEFFETLFHCVGLQIGHKAR